MKGILLVLLVVCVSYALAGNYAFAQFQDFKAKYGRKYAPEEEASRFEIFKQNLQKIHEHNNKRLSYSLGITEYADMTHEEFLQARTTAVQNFPDADKFARSSISIPQAPPASLDWRTSTTPVIVPPVRNSGACAGSTASAIVDSIAADYAKQYKDDVVVFDPAYVTDCDGQGCSGTTTQVAWNFITKYGLSWYYNGCPTAPGVGLCITGSNCTKSGSEAELQNAVYVHGPVPAMIDASRPSFQLYTSGVYYEASCSSSSVNHAVLIVGYGTLNGQDYWIARNSWGTGWGQKGDVFLARNKNNNCGVATSACYAKSIKTCVCEL